MAQTRINGKNIEVSREPLKHPTFKDDIYTISGDGAADLHARLMDVQAEPSALKDGAFTISGAALTYEGMPFLTTLKSKFDTAVSTGQSR